MSPQGRAPSLARNPTRHARTGGRAPRPDDGAVREHNGTAGERNGAVREQLAEIQRARILSAAVDVATELGATNVTVANVVERSGVSRRTFYELFSDREVCLHAAFEQALADACERVLPAYRAEKAWRDRIRAALVALLGFLDEQPSIGRLLIVESHSGGAATQKRRERIFAALVDAVEQGRHESRSGTTIPPLAGEGIVGGALSVIHSRLAEKDGESLLELTNPLMCMIVLPYLGAPASRRELARSLPVRANGRQRDATWPADPFKDAGMRLTYRTVRALMAVGDRPGASNRAIGEAAGMVDQGQISKLLGRLERIGLVCNDGLGSGKGAPNAWTLSDQGSRVVHTIGNRSGGSARAGGEAG